MDLLITGSFGTGRQRPGTGALRRHWWQMIDVCLRHACVLQSLRLHSFKSGSNTDESKLIVRLRRSAETSLMNFHTYSLLIKALRDFVKKNSLTCTLSLRCLPPFPLPSGFTPNPSSLSPLLQTVMHGCLCFPKVH